MPATLWLMYGDITVVEIANQNSSTLTHPPSVAVILAAYNGMQWLPEQLESILAQSGVQVTVFVSVDYSVDGTEAWIDSIAQTDKRVVVLPHGKRFGGAAPNFFRLLNDLDFSGFHYVSFADQDDIWLPEKLIRAHQVLSQSSADAYSSNVIAFWDSGRKKFIKKSQPQRRWDFLFEAAGPGCTYVMREHLVREIQAVLRKDWQAMRQVGLHDWFAYAYARAHGFSWVIDDYAGMLYRQHEGNQVGINHGWRALLFRTRKILNGWGIAQALLIAKLVGLGEDPFVKPWSNGSRAGFFRLAAHAAQCRRRTRDQILFFLSCLALSVTGSRKQ
jgi:rhamnosyltransferase